MEYRRLGNSGLKVSVVSLGSWLTYGNAVSDSSARKCLRAAIEHGVNLIDTADVYAKGEAEACLGKLLRDYRRQEIVLATKCFGAMSDDPNDRGLSRKHVFESIHGSLKRLRTDYVDLYQCHRYDPETPLEETVRVMDDLARQGKLLYWGVSCWDEAQIQAACEIADRTGAVRPISNQPPYNMLQREVEAAVVPACERLGLGQVVFSPLAQGLLTGKYRGGEVPPGSRLANDRINSFMKERMTEANLAKVDALAGVADDLGVTLPELALAWCLRLPSVASVIVGASRPRQVKENAKAAAVQLPDDALARIEGLLSGS